MNKSRDMQKLAGKGCRYRLLPAILAARDNLSMQKIVGTISVAIYLMFIAIVPTTAQTHGGNDAFVIQLFLLSIGLGLVIALPIFIAFYRKHPNRWPIFVITIIFGATGLGWLIALVWSLSAAHLSSEGSNGGESGMNLFVNDPVITKLDEAQTNRTEEAADKLQRLKSLYDADALTKEEYEAMRKPLLEQLINRASLR